MIRVSPGVTVDGSLPSALFADCFVISRRQFVDLIGWYQAVDHMDFLDVLSENLGNLHIYGHEFTGYLGRVDSVDSYLKCSMEALLPENHEEIFFGRRPVFTKIRDGVPTRYCVSANVTNSLIPNECTIRGHVENSILFPGVSVETDAVIKNSVIMQRSVVGRSTLVENVIADKFVTIGEGAIIMGSNDHPLVLRKKSAM
jgi:glucose-1-phosphate adenylyltransferase